MIIRKMKEKDIDIVAKIHRENFSRQHHSLDWIKCNYNAFPRSSCFITEINSRVVAYIIWTQKSGFRKKSIVELDQIAVSKNDQNNGIAKKLIKKSLKLLKNELKKFELELQHIIVSTRTDNHAQKIYEEILGAKPEITIKNLYSADEVLMIARNVK